MAEPLDSCVGYWKLENRFAEIGPDFTEIGGVGTYAVVKFNDGSYQNNTAKYLSAAGGVFTPNNFIYECWVKTDFNVVNGIRDNGTNNQLMNWLFAAANKNTVYFGASGLTFTVRVGGVNTNYISTHASLDLTAGNLYHLMFVYSQAGIASGADRCRMYFDGNLIFNSVATPAAFAVTGGELWLHTNRVHNLTSNMAIDNYKIYNNTSQLVIDAIRANRNNEEWPVAGFPLINGSLKSPLLESNMLN